MAQGPLVAAVAVQRGVAGYLGKNDQGALNVSPSLYASSLAGVVGFAANQTGATTSVALATTYTGLVLSNPAASGKNLSLLRVAGICNVAPAAFTAVGLITGWLAAGITVHTTPITLLNANVGLGVTGLVAKVDAAATLVGTPAWARWLTESIAATGEFQFDENVNGEIVIPPGGYVAIGTLIGGPTAGLLASFTWAEISV